MNRTRLKTCIKRCLKRGAAACLGLAVLGGGAFAIAWRASPFPTSRLDRRPSSPVVTDRSGRMLLTLVASDEQWRLPVSLDRISPWLIDATIAVEDERFYRHAGVDPIAVVRAIGQNLSAGRTVSGASTLTMQICRMMDDRPRGWGAKIVEAFRALQLERIRGKRQILDVYLNLAPYGRNIRGVEAASQAYFGKRAADLSLGEAALLAGLPQSPSRYRPDRWPAPARARRDHVLRRMRELGMITERQASLAGAESLILVEEKSPTAAPHAAWLALQRRPAGGRTTIDPSVQAEAQRLAVEHLRALPAGSQLAVAVLDITQSQIVAIVGSADPGNPVDGQVNGALARRSPGSTLKPFIYAAAFEAGLLNDQSTVYDVPIERAGWSPANFDQQFAGELPAADALRRSLNVPAILVAEATGLARCLGLIEAAGIGLPRNVQTRGGLAVVVGATETTLVDLVNGYATLGRGGVRRSARLFMDEGSDSARVLDADICAVLDEILSSRRRRPHGMQDRDERDVPWFMWKTGTSSGRRDAWAVGHNRRYAIGVWIGRFSGAGSDRFIGAEAAEPLLASLFDLPPLRCREDPPPAKRLPVPHPLSPPAELAAPLRIVSPTTGATYVALAGQAIIHARATRPASLTWFLNGAWLDGRSVQRIAVGPGQHELRCVEASGESAVVTFTVLNKPRGTNPLVMR